jgi:predicted metal-dependent enzyme (double-stranded beta helix superfamily)
MARDPALANDDQLFIEFVRKCEHAVNVLGNTIQARDEIALYAEDLALHWKMTDPAFRTLQSDVPYSSYQLYLNDARTLSIILDIFSPGQIAPIHNHRCWGVFVCLEGQELERRYTVPEDLSAPPVQSKVVHNGPRGVSVADAERHSFHQVECVGDVPAVSLHIYGADLKGTRRDRWDAPSESYVEFSSGRRQETNYLTEQGLHNGSV